MLIIQMIRVIHMIHSVMDHHVSLRTVLALMSSFLMYSKSLNTTVYNAVIWHSGGFLKHVAMSLFSKERYGGIDLTYYIHIIVIMTFKSSILDLDFDLKLRLDLA